MHGGARAAASVLAALAPRHDVMALYLRGDGEPPMDPTLRAACMRVVEVPRVPARGWWRRLAFALRRRLAQALGVPFWAAENGAGEFGARAREAAREWRPDVVHFDFFAMAQFAPAVAEAHAVHVLTPYELYSAAAAERSVTARGAARRRARRDVSRWRRYERRVAPAMDAIVAFTARDADDLRAVARPEAIVRIPLHVPVPDHPLDALGAAPPEVLFVGNFRHPPNGDAAMRLVRDIAPRLWTRAPDARVVIVGPEPSAELRAAAGERVLVTGAVDDVAPYLERAAVVATPLRLGAGMRVKVLEALAAGKAVVASPRALEGLDVADSGQVRIADDDAQFVAAIADLLESPSARAALAGRAREWAIAAFGSAGRADAYDALYDALDTRRGAVPVRRSAEVDAERAADWRFLLPRPASGRFDHLVVLGASPAMLRELAHREVAHELSSTLPNDGSASAAVVLPGAAVAAEALAAALRADGVAYVEVDRRRSGQRRSSPRGVVRSFGEAGLTVQRVYAVERSDLAPSRYLAVDDSAPMRWFLRDVYRPMTAAQWLAGIVKRALLRAAPRGRALQPVLRGYGIVATMRSGAPAPLALHALPQGVTLPPRAPLALLAEGGDRVVVLPFAHGASRPTVVIKVPRRAALRERTGNEQSRMAELRASLPRELARAIPEPLGLVQNEEIYAAAERALPGRTLLASSGGWRASRRRQLADLQLAGDWIAAFHAATIVERRPWSAAETADWVDALFERFDAAYGLEPAERRLHAAARDYAASLEGIVVPVAWSHRDYAVWNLARDGDRLAVLDWEGARIGPPLCDMLHLATTWRMVVGHTVGAHAEVESFRRIFVEPDARDRAAAVAIAAVRRYLERLALDERLVPMLTLHHRLELVVRRADQRAAQGMRDRQPRSDNPWIGAVTLLAAHTARLFDAPR
jgi:glycosyltransferase involved in cell wall biosynthesis/aminoglycoside phosphotransferase (APT) family kinase protein